MFLHIQHTYIHFNIHTFTVFQQLFIAYYARVFEYRAWTGFCITERARVCVCVCVSVEFVLGEALVKLKTKHNKHFLCTYVSLLLSLEFMQNSIHARTLVEFIGKIDTFFVCVAFSLRCFAFKFHYTTPAKQTSRNCYK